MAREFPEDDSTTRPATGEMQTRHLHRYRLMNARNAKRDKDTTYVHRTTTRDDTEYRNFPRDCSSTPRASPRNRRYLLHPRRIIASPRVDESLSRARALRIDRCEREINGGIYRYTHARIRTTLIV